MITHGRKRILDGAKNGLRIMSYFRELAVHDRGRLDDVAAKSRADRLVAKADAQCWDFCAEAPDYITGDACFFRRARAGRDDNLLRPQLGYLVQTDLVV